MSGVTESPVLQALTAYAPRPHPAPCDLDLAGGTSAGWADASIATTLAAGCARLSRYPDPRELVRRISTRLGIAPARVLVTAGADEALERACRSVLSTGRNAVLTDPTFEMLPRYVALAGGTVRPVAWPDGPFPVEEVIARADARTALIAIVSPNNPTGAVASFAEIRRVHDAVPDAMLLLDLAYVEFAATDPTSQALTLPRAVVVRTLSKAWGLPGIRVGYAAGAEALVDGMRRAGGPYPVSSLSLAVAEAALDADPAGRDATIARVRANRDKLESLLASLGQAPTPSQGNFVSVSGPRAGWIRDALAGFGIAVRFLGAPDRAGGGVDRVRITVPDSEQAMERLGRALSIALSPETILFDLDGVLADVSGSYREAIRRTAATFGVFVPPEAISARKARGQANDDWALTHELAAAGGSRATYTEVREVFEQWYQGTSAEPGLREAECLTVERAWLLGLAREYPLAIVTGRPRADAEWFLARVGIADCFRGVVAREDGPLKPDPFPVARALQLLGVTRAWMLGDTPDDIRSARGAGVLPLGVVLGPAATNWQEPENADQLRTALFAAGAARVFNSPTGLTSCLR
ncbi:MAG TPA: aminotransferase class I/II-fold pyridoxal phosphate-dependent enzyme [Gemmatimonadaceae bacterium]|nr:aminotransferase class I/II-fold pyridoxal phosphate-dependent enzyme [Gemmatimonadaceae bacterium]